MSRKISLLVEEQSFNDEIANFIQTEIKRVLRGDEVIKKMLADAIDKEISRRISFILEKQFKQFGDKYKIDKMVEEKALELLEPNKRAANTLAHNVYMLILEQPEVKGMLEKLNYYTLNKFFHELSPEEKEWLSKMPKHISK